MSKFQAINTRVAGGFLALVVAFVLFVPALPGVAVAQGIKDQLGTVTKSSEDLNRPAWMRKMAGSSLDLSTYLGSGTFYASGFYNPYASIALFARPTYDLGTRFKLSMNARIYLEQELTQSDLPNGRGFNPYDIWLWLAAKELHQFERSKVKLGGVVRLVLPLSFESRYAHLLTGVAVGLNLARVFELGQDPAPERRWSVTTVFSSVFTKYFYTSNLRGDSPGDSRGCREAVPGGFASGSTGGPTASESDRCGGPVNTNFALSTSGAATLTRGKTSLSVILLVANAFRYRVSRDLATMLPPSSVGQSDTTWGIVSLNYAFTPHVGASIGLSSYQPALDSRYRYPRFPFFDFSGTNANNYTQAFASLSGTL